MIRFKTASGSPNRASFWCILVQVIVKTEQTNHISKDVCKMLWNVYLYHLVYWLKWKHLRNTFWALNSCISVSCLWSRLGLPVTLLLAQHTDFDCTKHTWSRAAVHWQDWACKLLQMLLALNPTWVPAYGCQCPAASHLLLQIAFRLSQKDSWLPLCTNVPKFLLLFGAGCLDWEIQLKASCKLSRKW